METNATKAEYDLYQGPLGNVLDIYHIIVLILIEGFLLVGNIITLVVLKRYRELHHQKNMFIASLSVADLAVGLCGLTSAGIDIAQRTGADYFWNRTYVVSLCIMISFCHVICIALDRFIAVVKPLHYPSLMTKRTIYLMIMASWIFPIISMIPLYEYTAAHGNIDDIEIVYSKVTVIFCFIVIGVIWPLYGKVLFETRSQVRKIRAFAESFNNGSQSNASPTPRIKHKGTRMVLALLMTSYFLNCPYFIVQCLTWAGLSKKPAVIILRIFAAECMLANSAVNIVIYAAFSRDFRNAYRDMLCFCVKCT